jgi:hypothetical protein
MGNIHGFLGKKTSDGGSSLPGPDCTNRIHDRSPPRSGLETFLPFRIPPQKHRSLRRSGVVPLLPSVKERIHHCLRVLTNAITSRVTGTPAGEILTDSIKAIVLLIPRRRSVRLPLVNCQSQICAETRKILPIPLLSPPLSLLYLSYYSMLIRCFNIQRVRTHDPDDIVRSYSSLTLPHCDVCSNQVASMRQPIS